MPSLQERRIFQHIFWSRGANGTKTVLSDALGYAGVMVFAAQCVTNAGSIFYNLVDQDLSKLTSDQDFQYLVVDLVTIIEALVIVLACIRAVYFAAQLFDLPGDGN